MTSPKRKLIRLSLSNIDLVGAPANPEAWVALFKADVPVVKVDPDKRRVWGWASVAVDKAGADVIDSQGDVIDASALEEASVEFMLDSRASGVDHNGQPPVGRVFEAVYMSAEKSRVMGLPPGPVPTGLWIGVQVDDAATWSKVKAGALGAFSIEGQAQAKSAVENTSSRAATPTVKQAQEDLAYLVAKGEDRARRGGFYATDVHTAQVTNRPWREDPEAVKKYDRQRAEVAAGLKPRPVVPQLSDVEKAHRKLSKLEAELRERTR